jgi:hypothetical protein
MHFVHTSLIFSFTARIDIHTYGRNKMTWLFILIAIAVILAVAFLTLGSLFAIAMFGDEDDRPLIEIEDADLP